MDVSSAPSKLPAVNSEFGGQRSASYLYGAVGVRPASACRANRTELRRFIRRVTHGVIAENQRKTRRPGDLRVVPFPSKHSRVRIPSPALETFGRSIGLPFSGRDVDCNAPSMARVRALPILRSISPGPPIPSMRPHGPLFRRGVDSTHDVGVLARSRRRSKTRTASSRPALWTGYSELRIVRRCLEDPRIPP